MPLAVNPLVAGLRCSLTGRDLPTGDFASPIGLCSCCPAPGMPVEVVYDYDRARDRFGDQSVPGLWAYGALLPVVGVDRAYAAEVGRTPTVVHPALGESTGVEVWIKNEGSNPTGSFKDRGLSVGVALGAACGARRFCLPTQGNAGVSAAFFSSRLGLASARVYMPDGHRGSIYHRACEHFGGTVTFHGANIAAAGARMRDDLAHLLKSGEYVDLSTFLEPGRLEGKKTMGFEIFDHFGSECLPDWVFYPTGGGTGLVGIWKAFEELIRMGRMDRDRHPLPKMVAVQSENCAPVVRAFERGLDHVEPVDSRGTVAEGLDVPRAIMGHRMLALLRESGGAAVAVTESAIEASFAELGALGVSAGYESAALIAALESLVGSGVVREGERALLLMTSSPLIALGNVGR